MNKSGYHFGGHVVEEPLSVLLGRHTRNGLPVPQVLKSVLHLLLRAVVGEGIDYSYKIDTLSILAQYPSVYTLEECKVESVFI